MATIPKTLETYCLRKTKGKKKSERSEVPGVVKKAREI